MAQTKQVVLVTTVKTSGKVVKNRFVDFVGKQAAAGVKCWVLLLWMRMRAKCWPLMYWVSP